MSPKARTSKTPPSDSFALRRRLISATIARLASGSRQRTGEASTSAKSSTRELRSLRRRGGVHGGDLHDVRAHLHAQRGEERLGERPAGHARGGLARGGALEDVAHVALAVLPGAHEVGVAGARQVHLGNGMGPVRYWPGAHALLPVGVVAVGDVQRDGAAERAPVAHPAGDLGGVALDLHAPPAPVPELAARHVGVDVLSAQLKASGQALDDARESGAVGLPGGDKTQGHVRLIYLLPPRPVLWWLRPWRC